jgi:hypothetical protein
MYILKKSWHKVGDELLATIYNPMGEVISHNQRQLEWDPWGRPLKVTNEA